MIAYYSDAGEVVHHMEVDAVVGTVDGVDMFALDNRDYYQLLRVTYLYHLFQLLGQSKSPIDPRLCLSHAG